MSEPLQIPEPNYGDPKEIYAFFGLAYYCAALLEHGVMNLAVALLAKKVPGVTGDHVDRLYETFDKKTFGQIIKAAKTRFAFTSTLESDLAIALDHRNIGRC